jgi:hypothetical protein
VLYLVVVVPVYENSPLIRRITIYRRPGKKLLNELVEATARLHGSTQGWAPCSNPD